MHLLNLQRVFLKHARKQRTSRKRSYFLHILTTISVVLIVMNLLCICYNLSYNLDILQNLHDQYVLQTHELHVLQSRQSQAIAADVAYVSA